MDAAKEVDDCRTARRLFSTATTKEHIGHQHAHTRTRVGFDQEENGFAGFTSLLDTERREDTVVNGVVQEQNFRGFDEDRSQWQQVVLHHQIHARGENV